MVCLRTELPEVQAQLDKYTSILGSEDAAYYVLSENNGYDLDKAPNGQPSKLFSDLLSHFQGDENAAILAKSKVFTEGFKTWFGDWLSDDKTNVSKVVDENGEPLISDVVLDQGTFSTEDDNIHRREHSLIYNPNFEELNILNGIVWTNSRDLVLEVQKHLPSNSLVHKILSILSKTNVSVKIIYPRETDDQYAIKEATYVNKDGKTGQEYMYYLESTNTIYINGETMLDCSNSYNAESIAHEIVHAYTSAVITRARKGKATPEEMELYKTIAAMRAKYTEIFADKADEQGRFHGEYYGLNDEYDFVAELLTNRDFYGVLDNKAREKGLMQEFLDLLKKFINQFIQIFDLSSEISNVYDSLYDLFTFNVNNNIESSQLWDTETDMRSLEKQAGERLQRELEQQHQYTPEDEEQFNKTMSTLAQSILKSLQAKLKVLNDPDPARNAAIRNEAEWQIRNISEHLVSDLANVRNFLANARFEIRETCEFLRRAAKENLPISDQKLNDLNQNFLGFYEKIINDIHQNMLDKVAYREIIGKNSSGKYIYDEMMQRVESYHQMIAQSKAIIKRRIAESARQKMKEIGLEVSSTSIYNFDANSLNPEDFDISLFTAYVGSGDKVKDGVIKTLFYLINKAESETRKNVNVVHDELERLSNKFGIKYKLKALYELDDNGNSTGNLTRSRNFGKMEKNYNEAIEQICDELGIDKTQLMLPENREIRIAYNKRRNKWLSQHVERRFTADYYDKFNALSQETVTAREEIQTKIRNLLDKVRDENGIAQIHKLSLEERNEYFQALLEKKQLASIYDTKGNKKQGTALQIAEELTELNKSLQEGLKMTKNSAKYEAAKKKVMEDPNLTKDQKEEWLRLNRRIQYKQEFWDALKKLQKREYGPIYDKLAEARRAILNQFRNDFTQEIDVNMMPAAAKASLQFIERAMTRIRKAKKQQTVEGEYDFQQLVDYVPTEQWYKDKRLHYDLVYPEDPESAELWARSNGFYKNGKLYPKSWYTKMQPKDKSMIEEVPSNNWLEVSEDSPFVNKEFLRLQKENPDLVGEYWIPKAVVKDERGRVIEKYDTSDRLKRIQEDKDLNEVYEYAKKIIAESLSKYSNLRKTHPYRLPSKRGNVGRYISAVWRQERDTRKLLAPFKGTWNYIKDLLSVRNDDIGFQGVDTKPNGERLNLIPQYMLGRIENPEVISADFFGMLQAMYESAENWKQKTLIQPQVEILMDYARGKKYKNKKTGEVKQGESNVYKMAKAFVDMNLYDAQNTNVTVKPFGREVNITKLLSILRVLGTTRNLALNIACALTGGFTALYSHIVNQLVGRYYNPVDAWFGFKDMISDTLIGTARVLGLTGHKTFITKCMEMANVGADMNMNVSNRPQFINFILKHWGFGIYSMSDHIIKGTILSTLMHNFKLVMDKNGNRVFVSREQYKAEYRGNTHGIREFIDWEFGEYRSFRDCVTFEGGKLVSRDPSLQKEVDRAFQIIADTARTLAQSADGQLSKLQKPAMLAHFAGQFAMQHRQFMPVILQERFLMDRQYDYQMQRYREAMFKTFKRLAQDVISTNENKVQYLRKQWKEDPVIRENITKAFWEMAIWVSITYMLLPIFQNSADQDKKNILKQLIAFALEKTSFETLAPYNILAFNEILTSPFAIMSYVNTAIELTATPFNDIWNWISNSITELITGEDIPEKDRLIKRGAYKNMTPAERATIKLTPFKNLWELQDIQSKRDYYNKFIRNVDE